MGDDKYPFKCPHGSSCTARVRKFKTQRGLDRHIQRTHGQPKTGKFKQHRKDMD